MIDYLLALIPDYGLYIIFSVVFLACLGIPLPSSLLLLTAGGLSAAGDLSIWQVLLVAFAAFIAGDQLAFNIARNAGPPLLQFLHQRPRFAPLVGKSETMLQKHGLWAVLLSRTVFSPTGPFVSYVSGAVRLNPLSFTCVAALGAAIWTCCYGLMGYLFAGELPQISDLVASILIVGVALLCMIGFGIWSAIEWRRFSQLPDAHTGHG